MLVHVHLGIWSAYQPTNCEIRQPSQLLVDCPDQKTCDSTSHSDLTPLPMSHAGSLEYTADGLRTALVKVHPWTV